MSEVFLGERTLEMSILVTPSMSNFNGVMHGGELLKILDQVSYACATHCFGIGFVTLAVNSVLFKSPIPIGSLLNFLSSVNYAGNTSCEVGVRVVAQDLKKKVDTHCATAYFTMVAMQNGSKVQIPKLVPQTDQEKRRWEEAIKRKNSLMQS